LQNLAPIQPTFAEVLTKIADDWQERKLNTNPRWREFLEDFFQFRRERNW
jgi:hypothetical protein